MSEIKRYEPINIDGTCGICAEDANGAYVDYRDFAALNDELAALKDGVPAQDERWAVHAQGPDELYAAFSREDAEQPAA